MIARHFLISPKLLTKHQKVSIHTLLWRTFPSNRILQSQTWICLCQERRYYVVTRNSLKGSLSQTGSGRHVETTAEHLRMDSGQKHVYLCHFRYPRASPISAKHHIRYILYIHPHIHKRDSQFQSAQPAQHLPSSQ